MKLLLDNCVWGKAKQSLTAAGHDVVWAGDWENDPGDSEILSIAYNQGRVLITLDKDFGELAIVRRKQHCGIIRLANVSAKDQAEVCLRLLERLGSELIKGAIVTLEGQKLRIRPPDGKG